MPQLRPSIFTRVDVCSARRLQSLFLCTEYWIAWIGRAISGVAVYCVSVLLCFPLLQLSQCCQPLNTHSSPARTAPYSLFFRSTASIAIQDGTPSRLSTQSTPTTPSAVLRVSLLLTFSPGRLPSNTHTLNTGIPTWRRFNTRPRCARDRRASCVQTCPLAPQHPTTSTAMQHQQPRPRTATLRLPTRAQSRIQVPRSRVPGAAAAAAVRLTCTC